MDDLGNLLISRGCLNGAFGAVISGAQVEMIKAIAKMSLLILPFALSSPICGQSLETKLNRDLASYDSNRATTLEQLLELAQRFQLPMGIEWVDTPNEKPARPIQERNIKLRDVISRILSAQDGYKFVVANGLVQVMANGIDADSLNFLNITLPSYGAKMKSLWEVSYWLQVRIKVYLHPERNFGGGFGGTSAQADFNNRTITFSVVGSTVRQILNKIAVAQGNCLWVVHLNPSQLMEGERFYAQAISPTGKRSLRLYLGVYSATISELKWIELRSR